MLNHCLNFLYHAINLMPIVITSFINFKVADNVLNRFYKICEFRKNFLEESTQQKTFFFTSCPKLLETDVKIEEATVLQCWQSVGGWWGSGGHWSRWQWRRVPGRGWAWARCGRQPGAGHSYVIPSPAPPARRGKERFVFKKPTNNVCFRFYN